MQKILLADMEAIAEYKNNNPVLNKQREEVRKLHDKIVMYQAFEDYQTLKKDFCMFMAVDGCLGEIKNTFNHWFIYGNCCAVCNAHFGRASAIYLPYRDTPSPEKTNGIYSILPEVDEDPLELDEKVVAFMESLYLDED